MQIPQFTPGAIDAGGCASNAWDMLKRNYGIYIGITLIAILLTSCVPCLNIFILGPVMGGVYLVALRDMRGEPVDFGMMFKGFEKFVPLMVVGLLQAIPGIIAQVLQFTLDLGRIGLQGGGIGDSTFFQSAGRDSAIAGGLIVIAIVVGLLFSIFALVWWMVFFFAVPLVMEFDLGPGDAIKLSAQAAMANIGGLIVLIIFQILIMLVGILLLCIGAFLLSIPLIYLANAIAYRQVFPWFERQMNMAPPPPTAYGSSFGNAA